MGSAIRGPSRWAVSATCLVFLGMALAGCARPQPGPGSVQPSAKPSPPTTQTAPPVPRQAASETRRVTSPAKPAEGQSEAAEGKQIYQAQGCAGCHRINGQGSTIGPDLSHAAAARTSAWLAEKITNPKARQPKSAMPAYKLPADKLKDLVAYLSGFK